MRPAGLRAAAFAALLLGATPLAATAAELVVRKVQLADEKAVFATVESQNVVPARARIGGTVAGLAVRQGDAVRQGQPIASISDPKLALQVQSLEAQIEGARSRLAQAEQDLARAQTLARSGTASQAALEAATTAQRVARAALDSLARQRDVAREQMAEAVVLAPADGRVLDVPVTDGSVVLPGDALASVAERHYRLRLAVPERHARLLHVGDAVRVDEDGPAPANGRITLIYPLIQDGQVRVDAEAEGLGDYFVGGRVRVWVSAGTRAAFVVPAGFVTTRFGVDYVRVRAAAGLMDVPVQRGLPAPRPDMADGLEILTGLAEGETLVSAP